MRRIIIASHGGLADGAVSSARMIMGDKVPLLTYGMLPGDSATDFADILETKIIAEPEHQFIIAADLYGASVCSALYRLTVHPNVRLFAGFNLCLLLELMSDPDSHLDENEAAKLVDIACSGVRLLEAPQNTCQNEEDF